MCTNICAGIKRQADSFRASYKNCKNIFKFRQFFYIGSFLVASKGYSASPLVDRRTPSSGEVQSTSFPCLSPNSDIVEPVKLPFRLVPRIYCWTLPVISTTSSSISMKLTLAKTYSQTFAYSIGLFCFSCAF